MSKYSKQQAEYKRQSVVTVVVEPEVKQLLKDRAKKQVRSMSQMAATILTFELKTK